MDMANTALRRTMVRLRSLNSSNSDLNLIISELGEVKSSYKKFTVAQRQVWNDITSWASRECNLAVLETFKYLTELNKLWHDVQMDFMSGMKSLQRQFEIILESEKLLNKSRLHLSACEQKESKILKELRKVEERAPHKALERAKLSNDLSHASETTRAAQHEVRAKAVDNETVKNNEIRLGMLDLSETFIELAEKMTIVFSAHKKVSQCLPSVTRDDIQDIKYTGSQISQNAIDKAREELHCYKRPSNRISAPPPYTNLRNEPNHSMSSEGCPPYVNIPQRQHFYSEISISSPEPGFNVSSGAARYDLPPRENYENLPGLEQTSIAEGSWNRFYSDG